MSPFETFEGIFYRPIFTVILGIGGFGLGAYAVVHLTGWKKACAVIVALFGAILLVAGLSDVLKIMNRFHSW